MSTRDDVLATSTRRGEAPLRCLGTWAAVTALAGAILAGSLRAWPDTAAVLARLDQTPSPPLPDQLMVAAAHGVILTGTCWLWLLSTLLVLEAARGLPSTAPAPRWLRHAVLLGCGAVLAASPLPAHAGVHAQDTTSAPPPPSPQSALSGLPMPELPLTSAAPPRDHDRAAPPQRSAPKTAPRATTRHLIVRAGDTLWQIAERELPPEATQQQVAREADRLWRTNRAVIGAEPDLIQPGQELRR